MIQKHHHEANTQILYVSKIDLIALFFNNSKTKVNITKCNKAVFEIFISVVLYMYNIPNYNHKAVYRNIRHKINRICMYAHFIPTEYVHGV